LKEDKYPIPDEIKGDYEKAKELRLKGDLESAERIAKELLESYPEHPVLWNLLGSVNFSKKEYRKAEELFLKALGYGTDIPIIYSNLSRTYGILGELEKSAKYARRVIRLNPKLSSAWNTLGLYFVDRGDLEIAVDYFVAAFSYNDGDLESAFNAACALCQLGEREEALLYLEKSLRHKFFLKYALEDPTLAPLRELPRFGRIISEAERRFESEDGT
jgi:tetratricopeptide (TPR) repeat protein